MIQIEKKEEGEVGLKPLFHSDSTFAFEQTRLLERRSPVTLFCAIACSHSKLTNLLSYLAVQESR